jgi:type IV secretory pathway protease TraF
MRALAPYRKAVVAIVVAALTAAQTQVPMPDTLHAWVAVAIAALGAVGVYSVSNAPAVPAPVQLAPPSADAPAAAPAAVDANTPPAEPAAPVS